MKNGKDCRNDIGRLTKRLKKIKNKEVMNRYVVSGLMSVQRMLVGQQDLRGEIKECIERVVERARDIVNQTETIEKEFGGEDE